MSPRVSPDIKPANATRATHMIRYTQNIVSQQGTSFAAISRVIEKVKTINVETERK